MNPKEIYLERSLEIECKVDDIFQKIYPFLQRKIKNYIMYKDHHFIPIKDRISNDLHLFLELEDHTYFHLRAYTKHMLTHYKIFQEGLIFLTGYKKSSISLNEGKHSFRQDWYKQNSQEIAQEILEQNNNFS